MMTPREIIAANIEHADPPRCGLTFGRGRMNDMVVAGVAGPEGYAQRRWVEGDRQYYDDEWGNLWARMVDGSQKGEVCRPVLADWSQLGAMAVPRYDRGPIRDKLAADFAGAGEEWKMAFMGGWVFNDARYIRGMENYFCDMALYPEELKKLHSIVAAVYEIKIQAAGEAGAEGIFFCEDIGTQNGPLFSPRMWREFFKEDYTRLFGIAHEYGMKVFLHSCGKNDLLIDDLIEAGVDSFQFDQPEVYDMEALAEKFRRSKVCLWAPVDIQKVMPTGDKEYIQRETLRMLDLFRGGLIMKDYPDLPGIGVDPEWDDWVYEAIMENVGSESKGQA